MHDRPCPSLQRLIDLPEEKRVLGPYRLLRQLGRGGFAPVWLASEMYAEKEFRTVAVKLFCVEPGEQGAGFAGREQIIEEARALCRVEHPNIVRFYNFQTDTTGDVLGIVMEYARGASLDKTIQEKGKLPIGEVVALGCAISSALAEVHAAGIVHRDVKPGNVIDANGVYKLIDFGIAAGDRPVRSRREGPASRLVLRELPKDVKGTRLTALADTMVAGGDASFGGAALSEIPSGTLGYIDPDCISHLTPATAASDLYSLAALLYESVTGTVPAAAAAIVAGAGGLRPEVVDGRERPPPLLDVAPDAPPALARTVDALLDPDVKTRPASAADVRDALARIRDELSARATSPGATSPSPPPTTSRGRAGVVLAALVVVGTFVAVWFAARAGSPTKPSPQPRADAQAAVASADPDAEPPPTPDVPLAESPWSLAVADAQKKLAAGDGAGALAGLTDAVALDGGAVARTFVEQVGAVNAAGDSSPCRTTAFGVPRLDYSSPHTGRPSVAAVPGGAVVVWTDDHERPGHSHAYGAMIDETGRPTSAVRDLSPEGGNVFRPSLTQVGERVVLLYWDGAGDEPGVKVRWLRPDGRIAGPSVTVDKGRPANLWPALVPTPDGFVVAWQDDLGSGRGDEVYLRKLGHNLELVGDESQATSVGSVDASARTPTIALTDDRLVVAYVLDYETTRLLKLRRFAVGAADAAIDTRKQSTYPVTIVGDTKTAAAPDGPQVACGKDGCFLVWHGSPHSAYAAQVDVEKRQLVWHKNIANGGGHPALGEAPDGSLVVAYFDGGFVKVAALSGDGIGAASVVGKAAGDPPRAWVAPGQAAGEWYVAWQSVDGGDPLVARVACRAQ